MEAVRPPIFYMNHRVLKEVYRKFISALFVGVIGNVDLCHANPGALDNGFRSGAGIENGPVLSISKQDDGKLLVAGYFSEVNGTHEASVVRLQSDGSLDGSFHRSALGGHLHSVLVLLDGKILIGGEFGSVPDFPRTDLARLNSDGSLDQTFDPGEGSGAGHVDALALQSDGRIIVTGDFTYFNKSVRPGVVRLLPNGELDPTFDTGSGLQGHLPALAMGGDKILVGGGFTNVQGAVRLGITRLNSDGSLDPTFQINPGVTRETSEASVNAIALQPDGKIVIGGNFTQVNGHPCNRISRLNANGSLDLMFNTGRGVEGEANSSVEALALQDDGKIILAGLFTSVQGQPHRGIARLNKDGSLDRTFDSGTGVNDWIKTATVLPGGQVVLGGYFTQFNGVAVGRIARLEGDHRAADQRAVILSLNSSMAADGMPILMSGSVGCSYTIEFSEDLRSWHTLTNFISNETNTLVFDPGQSATTRRFYRSLTPP